MPSDATTLLPELRASVEQRLTEIDAIAAQRRAVLAPLADFVSDRVDSGSPSRLVFICTHNSRRSHMAQLWARAAAAVFSISDVETFSGGTEATAFNPRAVAALRRAGFLIEPFTDGKNPIYEVSFAPGMAPMQVFSKPLDAPANPTEDFAAVMTCSDADRACPTVTGAAARIAIPYDDPKASDGTLGEAEAYDERCAQIAREMLWVFSRVSHRA
jgi:protein-tyrosine phosphatase/arsenate reductase